MTAPDFASGKRYRMLSAYLRERFGGKVRSIAIDAGFTCPNVDGTITTGGCVFCDNRSFSPHRRLPRSTITAQIERSITILTKRYQAEQFLAYFQAGTNTHGSLEKLKRVYDEAIRHPRIVALAIGTRPDSLPEPVLDLLTEYAKQLPVFLELGVQTIHNRSLDWMNRGHHADVFFEAIERCEGRGLTLSTHVILGLPSETHADMMATADAIANQPLHSVKIHNLYVVKGTPVEEMYRRGELKTLEFEEYVPLVCDFVERLPSDFVMHRLSGEAPGDWLIAPEWARDKPALLKAIDDELLRRDSWQGKRFQPQSSPLSSRTTRLTLPMVN
jgi:hypothetical protein